MKKLSFFLATFAFVMGYAVAQPSINAVTPGQVNISNVTQYGEDHSATVSQEGTFMTSNLLQESQDNYAKVTQLNSRGKEIPVLSEISQTGAGNSAVVEQSSTSTATSDIVLGLMQAIINQSGDNNEAVQKQGPHKVQGQSFASIDQQGFGNFASQDQAKFMNSAVIVQTGSMNSAQQAQDALLINEDYVGSNNVAKIDQSGMVNDARQIQMGNSNKAEIIQPGVYNIADQDQALPSNFNDAKITQTGALNEAYQTQIGWLNTAVAEQPGQGNLLGQKQDLLAVLNNAYAIQSGNENEGYQDQTGVANHATIYQFSNKNYAEQDQSSIVRGAREVETIDGKVIMLNKATILQDVDENNAAVQIQWNGGGVMNEAIAVQEGKENISYQDQKGGFCYSLVQQAGNGNIADVRQSLFSIEK